MYCYKKLKTVLGFLCIFCSSTIPFSVYAEQISTQQASQQSSQQSSQQQVINNIDKFVGKPVALALLDKMRDAVINTDYQLYFLQSEMGEYANTFKYFHLATEQEQMANLIYLEGIPQEIILNNHIISYFKADSSSFSLASSRIIEAFPDVVYSDFSQLVDSYDFIVVGKGRTANRSAQLVRIVSKNKDRYNYVIWIDEESYLPLRIDLLDLNYTIIQQIKILDINLDFDKESFKNHIKTKDYPILFPNEKSDSEIHHWKLTYLPSGFQEVASYNINFYESSIDTQLFSDGIFSFSVNVSDSSDKNSHLFQQGVKTIYSVNNKLGNIVIIGNLPAETIKKIAQGITAK